MMHVNIERQNARALPGDNSRIGALVPDFFRALEQTTACEAVRNTDGLSIRGILEGSAVAWTHLLMHPEGDASVAIEAELTTLEPVYGELYALTVAQVGDRAVELILPAVALSLCYSEPHNAYLPTLAALATAPSGHALEHGRQIVADLPALPAAGPILGTSIQVRRADDNYRIYDSFIQGLESARGNVDAYTVLAEPAALGRMGSGSVPFVIITTDSFHPAPGVSWEDFVGRFMMMAVVLRVLSRKREETKVRRFLIDAWNEDILTKLLFGQYDLR